MREAIECGRLFGGDEKVPHHLCARRAKDGFGTERPSEEIHHVYRCLLREPRKSTSNRDVQAFTPFVDKAFRHFRGSNLPSLL